MSTTNTLLLVIAIVLAVSHLRELYDGVKILGKVFYYMGAAIWVLFDVTIIDMFRNNEVK